ncbi:MAG: cupin domain-containing protein [Alistipes indistinctus]
MLEGSVQLLYGQETYTLEKGDSIYYDSIVPHNLTTLAEGETAKVLAVTYTPF